VMGLFRRSEKDQQPAANEKILDEGFLMTIDGLVRFFGEYGVHVNLRETRGAPLRSRVEDALRALDEGIRELELMEESAVEPDKKRSIVLKRARKVRRQLESLANMNEKLKASRNAKQA